MLGVREPEVYGNCSFEDYLVKLRDRYGDCEIVYYQSNVEGEIINEIQKEGFVADGILLNAGGFTHTSVAIADAVAAVSTPVIEVHISNVFKREDFRHKSMLSPVVEGTIGGLGLMTYDLAIEYFLRVR